MRFRLALTVLLGLLLPPFAVSAPNLSEHILDFHSDISLQEDGTFVVRETIFVNSRGSLIKPTASASISAIPSYSSLKGFTLT